MTTVYALGSGSSGNAFAIECGEAALLIDAGFSAREIGRRAATVGLDLGRVQAVVITHEHSDHVNGAARLAAQLRIPVVTAHGTWDRIQPRMRGVTHRPLVLMGSVTVGAFQVEACPTSHDAAEPVAVAVRTASGHRVAVAYDLGRPTTAVRLLLREAHLLILEANHDDILLRTSGYPPVVQQRIAGSGGHLSNRAAAELLAELLHDGLHGVILAHLSERCNSEAEARAAILPVLERAGRPGPALHVARQDAPLPAITLPTPGLGLGLMTA
jgi:phosphoribosyl 1,2-cyclic phosphodiesterase